MSDNGDKTLRELVLDNTTRLMHMAEDIATVKQSVSSIEESIKVINHNSTATDCRLTSLETSRTVTATTLNTLKKIAYVGFSVVSLIGGSDLILHLIHVI